ncbi:hypothetical protein CVIRNUC_010299 [Coccomyxa viridis]|uniref:Phosphate acetyltransferase n=1 Tax=Coccomyxa viridis TaxID=1274662 RepID=A0AAV1IIB6_9CHLO|nr:hypothetical protein CVIRNUC_010299 [Coccomyxa viridis]
MLRNVQRVIGKTTYRPGQTTGSDVDAWAACIKADGRGHGLLAHQGRWLSAGTNKQHQTKTLYVMNVEGKRTTGPLLIGLLDYIQRWLPNVGYFEPIAGEPFRADTGVGASRYVELLTKAFDIKDAPEDMTAVSRREAVSALAHEKPGELLDRVFASFQDYKAKYKHDFVLVGGTHEEGAINVPGNRLELNARLAASLDAPVLMVLDANSATGIDDLVNKALVSRNGLTEERAEVMGLIVNKVPLRERALYRAQLARELGKHGLPLLGVAPFNPLISSVRMDEIQAALSVDIVSGRKHQTDLTVNQVYVATADLDTTLARISDLGTRPLVVTDRSRSDLLLGLTAASESPVGPHISGILCTNSTKGQADISTYVQHILDAKRAPHAAIEDTGFTAAFPVMSTKFGTWDTITAIDRIQPSIRPTSVAKIKEAKEMFQDHVDGGQLISALEAEREFVMTPKMFMHTINRICLRQPQRIVLPEAMDPRVLAAAEELTARGLAKIILLGEAEPVQAEARRLGLDISQCEIVDHLNAPQLDRYVDRLVEARKKKNLTPDGARDLLHDANYFGTMMTMCGDADGMVSGARHTTAATIRPGLQVLRTKDSPLVSSVFFMCLPDKVLIYGDCAVNVLPNAEELSQIATTSADTAAAFGIEPRVAVLSYSTFGSGSGPEVDKVTEAVKIAQERRPDLKLEGPLQYDAAVDPEVAKTKVKGESQVAGRATVCIFPSLDTGNNTYKAVQQSTHAIAIGPILQGLTRPVNDLSRGCTVVDIVNTVTCTAVQAVAIKEREAQPAGGAAAA